MAKLVIVVAMAWRGAPGLRTSSKKKAEQEETVEGRNLPVTNICKDKLISVSKERSSVVQERQVREWAKRVSQALSVMIPGTSICPCGGVFVDFGGCLGRSEVKFSIRNNRSKRAGATAVDLAKVGGDKATGRRCRTLSIIGYRKIIGVLG